MSYELVRVWGLFNVHLILHSLELLNLKSRREIHEGVRNTKMKKKKKRICLLILQKCGFSTVRSCVG